MTQEQLWDSTYKNGTKGNESKKDSSVGTINSYSKRKDEYDYGIFSSLEKAKEEAERRYNKNPDDYEYETISIYRATLDSQVGGMCDLFDQSNKVTEFYCKDGETDFAWHQP